MYKIKHTLMTLLLIGTALLLSACSGQGNGRGNMSTDKTHLGKMLFNVKFLSRNKTQSCSTCHVQSHASIDNRASLISSGTAMVSLGDDGTSHGDRNTPSVTYANQWPDFTFIDGIAKGGQFWDGREKDLQGQAGGPFLNPVEMNMGTKNDVIAELRTRKGLVKRFEAIYGNNILDDTDKAYLALTDAIASFEKTDAFSTFDSRYDRLSSAELTQKERDGMNLFFNRDTDPNCISCHAATGVAQTEKQQFTDFHYKNIGVPKNEVVRAHNGVADNMIDNGLFGNSAVNGDTNQKGKFKTPTLRNTGVTGPYMHNGVFKELRTAVKFHQHSITNSAFTANPETSGSWKDPEQPLNLDATLATSMALTGEQVDNLTCFLRALTDQRFESLIKEDGLVCSDD